MGRFRSPSVLARYRQQNPRCEICGGSQAIGGRVNGGVHHIEPRSAGGGDIESNLITLCTFCHSAAHDSTLTAEEILSHKGRFI
jgi:5-methylcytosine-specific restriction endonuclease McrA